MQSSLFSVGTTINVLLHCTSEPVFRLHLDARSEFHLLWGAMGLFLRKKHELLLEGLEPGMTRQLQASRSPLPGDLLSG